MKIGLRKPSFRKRVAARTSWKRVVRHQMGFKAPRGYGWITNPRRAAYNRIYNRTTFSADPFIAAGVGIVIAAIVGLFSSIGSIFSSRTSSTTQNPVNTGNAAYCPRCSSPMLLRNGRRGQFFGCSRFPYCRGTKNVPTS